MTSKPFFARILLHLVLATFAAVWLIPTLGLLVTSFRAPADIFGVAGRGYVREGYFADLVLVDPKKPTRVDSSNVLYKCGWSPFEGHKFSASIDTTIVNGEIVYRDGALTGIIAGRRLEFTRGR